MIPFHRFLIATAIIFCATFATWAFVAFRKDGGTTPLVLGIAFTIAALALAYYLKNLKRFLRR